MLKNRQITLSVDKKDKDPNSNIYPDPNAFEKNVTTVVRQLESIGVKMFFGLCIYVLLDTHRQVKVAQAIYTSTD